MRDPFNAFPARTGYWLKVLHFTLSANCAELINAYLNPTRAGRCGGVKERRVLPRHRVIFALSSFFLPFGRVRQRTGSTKVSALVNPEYLSRQ